jgi:ADP-heptose:LPS heptosyltransferase
MPPSTDNVLVLFPGALGDFVCFLPTLEALRRRHAGPMRVVAQPALLDLLRIRDTTTVSIHRSAIASLFADNTPISDAARALLGGFGAVYSWTGARSAQFATRLQSISTGRVGVYRFRGMRHGEHAVDYYARCVGFEGSPPVEAPKISADGEWAAEFLRAHGWAEHTILVVHPGSGAPRKNWQGFADVCRSWRRRYGDSVVVLQGPAEMENNSGICWDGIGVQELTLPRVTALLQQSAQYVGNDSGISHLAAAAGTRATVLFGPTDPLMWAPRGKRVRILHAPTPCEYCGIDVFCTHRLPIEDVIAALEA